MANRVTMTICGTEYTLVAEEDAAYMEKVGAMVDGEMRQLMDGAHMSRDNAAVLAAVNLADELCKARMELVEGELPRFVATIHQELAASRDVLRILENYKKHAGPDFAHELDVLTADMRSSSYEAALVRFEGRLASPMLSDIVRGLIGVLRGDDGRIYFQMLSHDMKQLELQRLKAQAAKIPPKIRVFSFLMLMCFMLTYIVIIVYQIINSLGALF